MQEGRPYSAVGKPSVSKESGWRCYILQQKRKFGVEFFGNVVVLLLRTRCSRRCRDLQGRELRQDLFNAANTLVTIVDFSVDDDSGKLVTNRIDRDQCLQCPDIEIVIE